LLNPYELAANILENLALRLLGDFFLAHFASPFDFYLLHPV
jgi:hypothetical protein